jgi:hypothetical protein
MRYLGLALLLVGCATHTQTIQIVNRTSRAIEQVYVYPVGGAKGASRGALAPNGSVSVQVKPGNVEVYALSAKLQVDEHTRDQPSASQDLEIKGPVEVILYDAGDKPAEVDRPGVFGIAFTLPKPAPPPADPGQEPLP